jgi:hypothetical protein
MKMFLEIFILDIARVFREKQDSADRAQGCVGQRHKQQGGCKTCQPARRSHTNKEAI